MHFRTIGSFIILIGLLVPSIGFSHEHEGRGDFLSSVNGALEEGIIDREEALLNVFRYAFDTNRVRPDLLLENLLPIKCLTPSLLDYERERDSFSLATVAEIDGYLNRSDVSNKTSRATYYSPGGHFELTYSTVGGDAVPSEDIDPANGIPDYVEHVAVYCDSSWTREVDELGFNAPYLSGGEKYQISFEHMGAYGYTVQLGGGRSYIVIENDFVGFPPNDDPDGNQLGAAKATCAHEFKHATQMNTDGAMAMGGWIELDAVWVEDVVFDETNDYYNYLGNGSGISDPDQGLDYGGTGSYEDAIWQHFLCEKFGIGMGLALMQRREAYPSEPVTLSYTEIISDAGSDFKTEHTNFVTWNYMTSVYVNTSLPGYEEAAGYPFPGFMDEVLSGDYPYTVSDSVDHMAAHLFVCKGLAGVPGNVRVIFTGDAGMDQSVVILTRLRATAGGGWIREDISLDASNNGDFTCSTLAVDVKQAAVCVINPRRRAAPATYTIEILIDTVSTGVEEAVPTALFHLEQNRPNPFNPVTTISFALPGEANPSLKVYNPAGRMIRSLLDGARMPAGTHSVVWDGLDDSGRSAASGVYYYRLESDNRTDTKRMVLIR